MSILPNLLQSRRPEFPELCGRLLLVIHFKTVWWLRRERICLQCGRPGFQPRVGKIPWRREWQPTPVFLPGESHGQKGLVGYSPWGCKQSDTTERPTLSWSAKKECRLPRERDPSRVHVSIPNYLSISPSSPPPAAISLRQVLMCYMLVVTADNTSVLPDLSSCSHRQDVQASTSG